MGYARYEVYRNGERIEAGYAVEDTCNRDGCEAKIDRGLGCLCGHTPGGDEFGCGHYFCEEHLFVSMRDDEPQMCEPCFDAAEKQAAKDAEETAVAQI
ncbi:hypothetical protein [Streptosporangium sp. CA-115845]|uniref:hypothetical protein n=1 Tax=Streptosporangium sp. CA-115845 TaxID=3240071 RepID=UPI003D942EFD